MIIRKKKMCLGPCGKEEYIFSHGFCIDCHKRRKKPEEKIYKRIAPLSDKRKIEQREYLKSRLIFLNEHQKCEAGLTGCRIWATEVHHKRGRIGRLLLNILYWLAVCRVCHRWIEEHPEEAKEKGFSLNRL